MPVASAAIAGGVGLIGDMMSQQGQQQTNAQSMAIAQKEMDWQTQMSNTAMQRRVTDLKAAGLNPALAVGQGGASVPSPVMPSLQNPSAAFGNLGGQASSAMQAGAQASLATSQADLNSANAASARADAVNKGVQAVKTAGVDTDAAKQGIAESQTRQVLEQAQTQSNMAQASLSTAQVSVANAQLPKIQAEIGALGASKSLDEARSHLTDLSSVMQGLSNQQFAAISPSLVTSAANAARASGLNLAELDKQSKMWSSSFGTAKPYVDTITTWLGKFGNIGGLIPVP